MTFLDGPRKKRPWSSIVVFDCYDLSVEVKKLGQLAEKRHDDVEVVRWRDSHA